MTKSNERKKKARKQAVSNRREQLRAASPLCRFTADELREVRLERRMMNNAKVTANMMETAFNALWSALRSKYDLPLKVDLDESTGDVFAAKEG
jgi:hypothetical protein